MWGGVTMESTEAVQGEGMRTEGIRDVFYNVWRGWWQWVWRRGSVAGWIRVVLFFSWRESLNLRIVKINYKCHQLKNFLKLILCLHVHVLHSWNVGRRVCGSGSLFPQGVFGRVHFLPVWLVKKAHVHCCLQRMRVNLPSPTNPTFSFSLFSQMHKVQLCFPPWSSFTYLWAIEILLIFRPWWLIHLSVCLTHTVEGFSSLFYSCFDHPQQ